MFVYVDVKPRGNFASPHPPSIMSTYHVLLDTLLVPCGPAFSVLLRIFFPWSIRFLTMEVSCPSTRRKCVPDCMRLVTAHSAVGVSFVLNASSVSDKVARPRNRGSLLSCRIKILSSPPGCLVHPVPIKWVPLLVSRKQSGRSVKLDTHLHEVPSLNYMEMCKFMLWCLILCNLNIF